MERVVISGKELGTPVVVHINGDFIEYMMETKGNKMSYTRIRNEFGQEYAIEETIDNIYKTITAKKKAASSFKMLKLHDGNRVIVNFAKVACIIENPNNSIIRLLSGDNIVVESVIGKLIKLWK